MNRLATFFFLALLVSCVKDPHDIPPGIQTNPVFFSELSTGQDLLSLTAGHNGYALQTEHYTDGEGITHYVARLSAEVCPQADCPSLEIEFFDNQVVSHPESGVDHTFGPGSKDYYSAKDDGKLDITFFLAPNGFGSSVSFSTSGGDTMPLTTSEIHLQAQPEEFIDLCFFRQENMTCNGDASYCFHTLASSPFIGSLKAERSFGDHILVEMNLLPGNGPFTYDWMNGSTAPYILVPAIEGEEVSISVTVKDNKNSTIDIQQNIIVENDTAKICGGTPQLIYSIADAPFTQFSSVIIRFTDSEGRVWSSEFGPQPGSTMEIRSVTDFMQSPEGFATKQLELAFSGILYSPDGLESMPLSTTNTVVAVSHD
jgi:hypothetical protein